jgi:hypothetical protein
LVGARWKQSPRDCMLGCRQWRMGSALDTPIGWIHHSSRPQTRMRTTAIDGDGRIVSP